MRYLRAAVVSTLFGCGGQTTLIGDCPPSPQQQIALGSMVLFTTCVGCHSSQLIGDERFGVPPGLDFDDRAVVGAWADRIYRTAREGSMPPPTADVPRLSDAQVEALRIYLACDDTASLFVLRQ